MMDAMIEKEPDQIDTAIRGAFHTAPLAAAPPLLYAAVMRRVCREPPPRFRIGWLDLALSLFASLMLGMAWLVFLAAPANWLSYLRMLVLWNLQKLWHLDAGLFAWGALTLAALLACLAIAAWSFSRQGEVSPR